MDTRAPLKRPLFFSFLTIAVLAVATSLTAFLAGRQMIADQDRQLGHRAEALLDARQLNASVLERFLALRSYLQSGDVRHLERAEEVRWRIRALIARFRSDGVAPEQRFVARIDSLEREHTLLADRMITLRRTGDAAAALRANDETQPLRETLLADVLSFETGREARFRAAREETRRAGDRALWLVSVLGAIGAVSLAVVAIFMNTTLSRVYRQERRSREAAEEARTEVETLAAGLRAGEQRLRLATDAADLGVFEWDLTTGRTVYENPQMYAILGLLDSQPPYSRTEFLTSVVHPEDRDAVVKSLGDPLPAGDVSQCACRIQRLDGAWRWIEIAARIERGDDGAPRRVIAVVGDITERRALEQKLLDSEEHLKRRVAARTDELEGSLRRISTFSYTVSHDLRAPLRAMRGYAETLEDDFKDKLAPPADIYLRRIREAASHMNDMIDGLLEVARISHVDLPRAIVDLDVAARAALRQLEADLIERCAHVEMDFAAARHVKANSNTLVQVLANLISNACKFTTPGREPRIRIWSERVMQVVRIHVQDEGIGIAPEHQERIFGLFERLHERDAYAGTGVGLAMVKQAIDRMGGRIGVHSQLGEGSRFWIELAAPPRDDAAAVADDAPQFAEPPKG